MRVISLKNLIAFQSIIIGCISFCWAVSDSDFTIGISAKNKGDLAVAQEKLASAYKNNPNNLSIRMAYASVAPCSTGIRLYKSVAELTSAPDSLRGAAYAKLGDYFYTGNNFAKSIEAYRNASKVGKKSLYRHFWALAALASGDEESAKSLWHTLSLEYGEDLALMAQYYLGLIDLKHNKYQDALSCFSKAGTSSASKPWTIAALEGKLECARKLKMNEKTTQFEKELQPYRTYILEERYLQSTYTTLQKNDTVSITTAHQELDDDTTDEKDDSLQLFTLQVGAFSSKENAQALEKKLSVHFSNIVISPVKIDEQSFFRVWIGSFKSKSAAEAFAAESLANSKLSFKVVEK